jgi:Heat shock protein
MPGRRAASALAAAAALAACAAPAPQPAGPPALQGVLWRLDRLNGEPVEPVITLAFGAEELRGAGPCNRYFGAWAQEGDRLALGPIAATRRACPDLDLEQRYFAALTDVAAFSGDRRRLVMRDAEGEARMEFRLR